jgi:4-carboxymuconolactone decarboxylase
MTRVGPVTRDQVPSELRSTYDQVVALCGGEITPGPTWVLANSPALAVHTRSLTNYLWGESPLPRKIKQLAVLVTARMMDCQYVWNAHVGHGREAGLSDALLDALREKQPLPHLPADEAVVVNYAMEFFKTHRVSNETFQAASDHFGTHLLAELTALMGYYAMVSHVLIAFEFDGQEPGKEALLPIQGN